MILGIDTSAGQCAVALVAGGELRARRAERMTRGHAERLFPLVEAALGEAGASYRDIARIGACTGPGSFTGIRVGVSAARGLALGLEVTAHGIDRFHALAWDWCERTGRDPAEAMADTPPLAIALAGPRDTVFLRIATPRADPPRQVTRAEAETVAPREAIRLGDGWPGAREEDGLPDPAAIARAVADAAPHPGEPKPFYLRPPNADPPRDAPPRMLD